MTKTELTPPRFDALVRGAPPHPRIIWTAAGIGRRLNCGEDYVRRTLFGMPGSPIRRKGRRLYAFEDDLIAWMRDSAG